MRLLNAALSVEALLAQANGLVSDLLENADKFSGDQIDLQMEIRGHLAAAKSAALRLVNGMLQHSGSVDLVELVDFHSQVVTHRWNEPCPARVANGPCPGHAPAPPDPTRPKPPAAAAEVAP
jgi:hypothetical protein